MNNKKSAIGILLLLLLFVLSSCGPVNRLTCVKKTPREYSLNYCGEDIRAPLTPYNKELWIVFADRDNETTYQNPGGKVKLKKVNFLDAFFVIKRKGDYLQLIKYDPSIVENTLLSGKLKDRKKVEYYGWMHMSHLLLTRQSVTDIATGFKNKQVSIVADTTTLTNPGRFFMKDSIRVFKDANLTVENGIIPFYNIVYTLKTTPDGERALVARKTGISPDSVHTEVLGWLHSSLVRDIGQRLHVDFASVPRDSFLFKDSRLDNTLSLSGQVFEESLRFGKRYPALKYGPVASWCRENASNMSFKTGMPLQVVDRTDNFVFNVNGDKIMYDRFKTIEKDLKQINLMFIFEGRQEVVNSYTGIINVIQNLQPLFAKEDETFRYKFGAVIASQGRTLTSAPQIKTTGLTSNYTEMLDYLITETDSGHHYLPLPVQYTWSGVRKAVEMVEPYSNETNIFIIIGEEGQTEWADSVLVRRMAAANCRILGYQMYGKEENAGNNFVLQIENMIDHCAERQSISKREKIVFVDQLRTENRYRESSKNVYALDFPDKSMAQGWVLFPEKNVSLPLDILAKSIDSLLLEVKWDNDHLTTSLYKAFNTVGNHRYRYDPLFMQYNRLDSTQHALHTELPQMFASELPAFYVPAQKAVLPDTLERDFRYHLLLSVDELDQLKEFLDNLFAVQVDYKYQGKRKKAAKRCNCPDDDILPPENKPEPGSPDHPGYLSTRNARSNLYKTYMSELKTCRLCEINTKTLKKYTLAEAQRQIIGCPTYNSPLLEQYVIDDIKKKKRIPDAQLDELIEYFKQKKDVLDRFMTSADRFESNGQTYYWIDQRMLP